MSYIQALQDLGLGFELIAYLLFGGLFGAIVGLFLRFTKKKEPIIEDGNSQTIEEENIEIIEKEEEENTEEELKEIISDEYIEEENSKKLKSIF